MTKFITIGSVYNSSFTETAMPEKDYSSVGFKKLMKLIYQILMILLIRIIMENQPVVDGAVLRTRKNTKTTILRKKFREKYEI